MIRPTGRQLVRGLVVEHRLHVARGGRHEQDLESSAGHGVARGEVGVADLDGNRDVGGEREGAVGGGDQRQVPGQRAVPGQDVAVGGAEAHHQVHGRAVTSGVIEPPGQGSVGAVE